MLVTMPLSLHDLRAGADVFSHDGEKLGTLKHMVLKRSDLTLTHVVVDIGFLRSGHHLWEGGLGLDYDRVVPVDELHAVTDDRVELRLTAPEFKDMPEYTEEHFEDPHDLTPDDFDLTDVLVQAQRLAGFVNNVSNAWLVQRLNKPLDSVDIAEGTDVWRQNPHQKLGDIKRLLFDPATERLRAFVIRRGIIFQKDVVLPVRYITALYDDLVHVELTDAQLSQLREYEEQDE
jgi:uncharacterized protein YrrD